jgi:hypothetical protein
MERRSVVPAMLHNLAGPRAGHAAGWWSPCQTHCVSSPMPPRKEAMPNARPTTYRGIQMRSRLEANFAQTFLDGLHAGEWAYEPECFGSEDGQYLPDFNLNGAYIEVKPDNLPVIEGHPRHPDTSVVDEILQRMEIVWASKPNAQLFLMLWNYDDGAKHMFAAQGNDRIWWWSAGAREGSWALWPGRGQLDALKSQRGG